MSQVERTFVQAGAEVIDDLELVRRLHARDGAAFELLMRRHNRRLFRLARSILRDSAEAEDALQEAYLAAFRGLSRFRGDSSLVTWLSRVVTNECLERLRRQARREKIVPITSTVMEGHDEQEPERSAAAGNDAEAPDAMLGRAELRVLLERRIDDLPDVFRTVFVLRGVEELSVEETALCLDIPEATVRTRYFRARGMLRESLAQDMNLAERDVFSFDGGRCDRIVARVLARGRDSGAF